MSITLKNAEIGEVYKLAPRLRAEDIEEIKACGYNPFRGLYISIKNSFICKSVYEYNEIIGMFGACYSSPEWVRVWFLGSGECEKYPITFVKEGKKFIKELLKKYNVFNQIYKKNKTHVEFIKRLGFTIEKSILDNFYVFYKEKEM